MCISPYQCASHSRYYGYLWFIVHSHFLLDLESRWVDVLHVAGGRGGMSVSKSWPCCSGCGGWWRRPLVCWSVPSCQILLLVAGARLAGPSRKGASVWPSSAAAVAVLAGCNSTRCPDSQQGIPAAPCTLRIRRLTRNSDCRLGFI